MPTAQGRLHYYYGLEQMRCLASWVVTAGATVVLGSLGIIVSFVDYRGDITHACARFWARTFLWIHGVHLDARGLAELVPGTDYVFVANHNSALDIPALLAALPLRFRMVAKESLFRIPFLGWYMRRVGYVPVPRSSATDLGEAARALQNSSILVFPEGTRTDEQELARFRKGGFFLARQTESPIVPVAVINSGRLLPRGKAWVNLGVVEVRVGKPIDSTGDESLAELAERCRTAVATLPL
ncbi:MAG: 1-acyl-sn-glycerol-3-phosphate acyltransferase [Acidobacteria bacterium]|nr:1-acyl-sn-glycerol-3-phosphate acyltransferase [Acidobacteriota bacterium]